MPLGQAFTVLTEFKFEVGEAVLKTNALTGQVDKLSMAADNALNSFQYAAAGIVGSFTGATGILGVLYAAVTAADSFQKTQIAMANTLSQPGETFASAMERSAQAMEQIERISKRFSLPAEDLMNITKLLGPMLQVHGLSGYNYSSAINLGRKFLKASPMLGVDSSLAMGQLQNIIGGHASMGDTLFQRLTAETKTMAPFSGSSQSFNALNEKKRFDILNKALEEFTKNTAAINAQARTFSGEVQRLKNNLSGAFSILRQIGEVIMKPVLQVLNGLNNFLEQNGKKISANVARMIEPWLSDAKSVIATLMQMKRLKQDLASTAHLFGTIAALLLLNEALLFLGVSIPFVSAGLLKFSALIKFFTGAISAISIAGPTTGIFGFLNMLTVFLSELLVPLGLVVFAFQLLSRALAHAKMNALENIAAAMPRITEAFANFSGLLGLFMEGFDSLARGLGTILDPTRFLGFIDLVDVAVSSLEFLTSVIATAVMGFQGLALAIMETFNQIKSFLTGGGFDTGAIAKAFDFGMEETYNKIYGRVSEGQGGVQNQTVNMDVKMENHFKEMLEPDRVAFTIKDQLLKASQNKTTASRNAFALPAGSR